MYVFLDKLFISALFSMMNQTVKNQTSLEDFEEFDLRDTINVALYGFMSVGELEEVKNKH